MLQPRDKKIDLDREKKKIDGITKKGPVKSRGDFSLHCVCVCSVAKNCYYSRLVLLVDGTLGAVASPFLARSPLYFAGLRDSITTEDYEHFDRSH